MEVSKRFTLHRTGQPQVKHLQARPQPLRKLLAGRITFTPDPAGGVRLTGQGTLAPLVGMLQIPGVQALVAPRGFELVFSSRLILVLRL